MAEHYDLVIVGAGWQGIAAAKIYLDLYPSGNLLVIDANSTLGGVWALENFSPKLQTQGPLGTFEYSFYPLSTEEFGVRPGAHIPAHAVHRYLCRVVEKFNIASRIRFNVKVISAQPEASGGWHLETVGATGTQTISCSKLIIATGVTSIPKVLKIPGSKEFNGPLIGYKELADMERSSFLKDPSIKTVTVLGGSKAAHDAVYWSSLLGKKVNWVVQRSGQGVFWMTSSPNTYFLGRKVVVEAMATTRLFSLFSPCIWGKADGYCWSRWFLHQTWFGRSIVQFFWRSIGASVLKSTRLNLAGATEKARPDFDFHWQASSAGTLNYDGDFYAGIRSGQVTIHRKNLSTLTSNEVHFTDGSHLQTDAFIYCAGWKWISPIGFKGVSTLELGIPTKMNKSTNTQDWEMRCRHADEQVFEQLPYLRSAPVAPSRLSSYKFGAEEDGEAYTSWCLHRAIAPPNQACEKSAKNIAFLGLFSTLPTAALCEIQSLWAIAFLHDKIDHMPRAAASSEEEATLWTRWDRLRYPYSHASKFMDTSFDILPYFDVLLSDMGLRPQRKSSWWKELWEPYGAGDYKGLVDEFKIQHRL